MVDVDRTLLNVVPISGNGLIQAYDPDTSAQVADDAALRTSASAVAIAVYTLSAPDPSAAPGDDLAVVSIVRLRDPSVGDEWFRDWRDTYDEAACANAGGVDRHAETQINGRTVFVGGCAGGVFTYHTRLEDQGVVVSITSIGAAKVGETVLQRIAP